ncbi:hypothetical protein ARMGADRAFT_1021642 [Armillaria gallica]|uniref:Uncharacterized protein n=1 Tax=Armillaria gallica TaxID=47427 RepID=A0A2H3CVB0_ARMGA|nr:hypothetical protein ARMGADRAFT_1021642 [Armillaria gallica]
MYGYVSQHAPFLQISFGDRSSTIDIHAMLSGRVQRAAIAPVASPKQDGEGSLRYVVRSRRQQKHSTLACVVSSVFDEASSDSSLRRRARVLVVNKISESIRLMGKVWIEAAMQQPFSAVKLQVCNTLLRFREF